MKVTRAWATPLTIGTFGLMAITGILMFFHLDTGLNKLAHEWLGWLMVLGVVMHAIANWAAFKRYFLSSVLGRSILGVSALIIALSFLPTPEALQHDSPPKIAFTAMINAPINHVSIVAGKPVDAVMLALNEANIHVINSETNLVSAVGSDKALMAKAMQIIFDRNTK
jgi:hypothetical protein